MNRRTAVAALTGALLLGVLGAPALAGPVTSDGSSTICLRTDSTSGQRDGVCVWLPVDR